MKFRKVEIQAFRVYDKAEDGTFNFEISKNNSADFISLYAPNGFGKTSFYDAIEFGVTNNIHRFIKKQNFNDETAKSERNLSSSEKQYILRNKFSAANLEGYVKYITTESETPVERKIPTPRKGGRDFKFDDKDTEKRYFKEVVLSQEWIDAFLKEDKAEDRYETFIEYFGDKEINDYYKKVVALISLNEKIIEGLIKELDGIQQELDFSGDKNILKKVNERIDILRKGGEKLDAIKDSFSATDSLKLSNNISERKSDLEFEKEKKEELIKFIELTFSGSDEIMGIAKYYHSKEEIIQLSKRQADNIQILEKYESRKKTINEINNLQKRNKEIISKKNAHESIKNEFNQYAKILTELKQNDDTLKKLTLEGNASEERLSVLKKTESEETVRKNSIHNQILAIEKILADLPQVKQSIESHNLQLKEWQAKIVDFNYAIESNTKSKSLLEESVNELNLAIKNINNSVYPSILENDYTQYEKLILELISKEKELREEVNKISDINKSIEEQETFNKEIEQFISKGSELINKNQSSSCILCNQEYGSYKILAEKVSNNKWLSHLLSNLLKERVEKENLVNQLIENIRLNKEVLTNSLIQDLTLKDKRLFDILNTIKNQVYDRNKILKYRDEISGKLNEYILSFNGLSVEEHENKLNDSLITLKSQLPGAVDKIDSMKNTIIKESENLNAIKEKSSNLQKEKQKLEQNSAYLKILNFFNENHPDENINVLIIEDKLRELTNFSINNVRTEEKLEKIIWELDDSLKIYKEEEIIEQQKMHSQTFESIQQATTSFEQFVSNKTNISLPAFTIQSVTQELNSRKRVLEVEISNFETLLKNYELLSELKNNVEPYLKYEKAKINEKEKKERIKFLKEKVAKELENEKKNVSSHIDDQINSFFYKDLINDLYRKIDPHPDYKNIKFKCDFEDDNPKLNVCVYEKSEDDLIIPNLYFSTAQLNILSLSIFLAKALNAKDEKGKPLNCIFIDDPIQSMDSINILSTIDLLRSIVVNHQKQIILSTHDENFHNLLKKKMPPNLFKSKFLELESFGKVKKDSHIIPDPRSSFDVILNATGNARLAIIKLVKEISGLGLKEATNLVDSAPKTIKEGTDKATADELKKKLENAGAKVKLKKGS